jgi:hypothetical protein
MEDKRCGPTPGSIAVSQYAKLIETVTAAFFLNCRKTRWLLSSSAGARQLD